MSRMTLSDVEAHQRRVKAPSGSPAQPSGRLSSYRSKKYGAVRTEVNGIWFDSKAEAAHYRRLQLLEAAGMISDLRVHSRWPLVVNGVDCGAYESDFDHVENGTRVIIDVKGKPTDLYQFKRKVFEALYPVKILEIRKAARGSI